MALFVVRKHAIGRTHEIIHEQEGSRSITGEYKATIEETFVIPDGMSLTEAIKLYHAGIRPKSNYSEK